MSQRLIEGWSVMEWQMKLCEPQTTHGCTCSVSALTPKNCETGLYPTCSKNGYEAGKLHGVHTVILRQPGRGGAAGAHCYKSTGACYPLTQRHTEGRSVM